MSLQELILHPKPGTVISLEGDAAWLGMPSIMTADLYVRPCYPELLMAQEQALSSRIHRDARLPRASAHWNENSLSIFTGNSGLLKPRKVLCHLKQLLSVFCACKLEAHMRRHWEESLGSAFCRASIGERL